MPKKKWLFVMIAAALVVVLAVIGAWGISRLLPSYSRVLEANWGVSLPAKALLSETYRKDSGASFHGDGIRYHVFSYKYEDYIDLMFAWSPNEPTTRFYGTASEAAEFWLDEIDVPAEYRPDYAACSCWRKTKSDNSEILIFWDSEQNHLYIIENLL